LQQRVTAVRLFFDFLVEEHVREENPVGRGRYTHELRNEVDGASSLWSSNYPCDRAGLGGGMTIPLTESQITPMIQNPPFPASQSTPTAVGAFS